MAVLERRRKCFVDLALFLFTRHWFDDPMYKEHRKRPQPDSTDWAIDIPVFGFGLGRHGE